MTALDGATLRGRRERLGLSQGQLARALGVEPITISRWERDDKVIGNPVLLDLALQTIERSLSTQRPVSQRSDTAPAEGEGL